MEIYDRATKAIQPEDQYEMFNIYIKRAAELFGVTHTRSIYEKAIEVLDDEHAREMCMRFADLERKLGEIDRARALFAYCSQLCDPRSTASFWQSWKEFEVKHGNEDTVREMLRIKRSVQAKYNTQVNFMSAQMLAAQSSHLTTAEPPPNEGNEMQMLEEASRALADEAAKDKLKPDRSILYVRSEATDEELGEMIKTNNPEEIDIDEGSSDEGEKVEELVLEKKTVPSEVFGDLAADDD